LSQQQWRREGMGMGMGMGRRKFEDLALARHRLAPLTGVGAVLGEAALGVRA
jgi:hypothetical protein